MTALSVDLQHWPDRDADPAYREAWFRAACEALGISYEDLEEDRAFFAGTASPEVVVRVNARARAQLDGFCWTLKLLPFKPSPMFSASFPRVPR